MIAAFTILFARPLGHPGFRVALFFIIVVVGIVYTVRTARPLPRTREQEEQIDFVFGARTRAERPTKIIQLLVFMACAAAVSVTAVHFIGGYPFINDRFFLLIPFLILAVAVLTFLIPGLDRSFRPYPREPGMRVVAYFFLFIARVGIGVPVVYLLLTVFIAANCVRDTSVRTSQVVCTRKATFLHRGFAYHRVFFRPPGLGRDYSFEVPEEFFN